HRGRRDRGPGRPGGRRARGHRPRGPHRRPRRGRARLRGTLMRIGLAGRIAGAFIDSKLTPLLIAASLGLGALALLATPREEEPQIRVPLVDVAVAWPGADPAEVETRMLEPLERAFWGISGVEHVYATA